MRKIFKGILILFIGFTMSFTSIIAQEEIEEEEETELVFEDIIKINGLNEIHKLKQYDTEILKYEILDEDYTLEVSLEPDNVISFSHDENTITVTANEAGEAILNLRLISEENELETNIHYHVESEEIIFSFIDKEIYLNLNDSLEIKYDLFPKTYDKSKIVWSSEAPKVVRVENGIIKALKAGSTSISAEVNEKTYKINVYVRIPLNKIEFNSNKISLSINESIDLPEVIYVPYNTTDNKSLTYEILDKSIVELDDGKLRGLNVGSTKLIARAGNVETELDIDVIQRGINKEAQLYLLETVDEDDSIIHLKIRDYKELTKDNFEVYLPSQDVLNFMANKKLAKVFIYFEDELIDNLDKLVNMRIEKDILLQLGAQNIEFNILNSKGTILYKFLFTERIKNNYNLKFSLDKLNEAFEEYKVVKNEHSYLFSLKETNIDGIIVYLHQSLFGSEENQLHYIYAIEDLSVIDSIDGMNGDEDSFIKFELKSPSTIISLSPVSSQIDYAAIVLLALTILGFVSFGVLNAYKKRRNMV